MADIDMLSALRQTTTKVKEYVDKKAGGEQINVDAEMKSYINVVKPAIRQSIVNKGGTVLDTDAFGDYAKRIDELPTQVKPAETLPMQTNLVGAGLQDKLGVQLNWEDVGADGYVIVRKLGSEPISSADGDMVYNGAYKLDGFLDTNVARNNIYFYRIFPRNSANQYQSIAKGSIAKVDYKDRTGQKLLKDLALGELLCFGKYQGQALKWKIVDKQDVASGFITVACENSLGNKSWDNSENLASNPNPDNARKSWGNNNWGLSNIRQYLNSDKAKGTWYVSQHQYDNAPPYKNENAFLHEFNTFEKNIFVEKKTKTIRCSLDGGGYETVNDKVWFPSNYAVNLGTDLVEDAHGLEYFDSDEKRKFNGNAWWLRSMNGATSTGSHVRCVGAGGTLSGNNAFNNVAVRPFCQLPTSAYMTWNDSDKAYTFADDSQHGLA